MAVRVGVGPERDIETVFEVTSRTITYGLEQSIRIFPSWSTVMNANVGSTRAFTSVRSIP
jgi:hypothetical protein